MILTRHLIAVAALCLIPLTSFAENQNAVPYDDLTFFPQREGSPVEMAVLWGDPKSGPSGVLLKLPSGWEAPVHSHSSSYRAIVIEGSPIHMLDGAANPTAFGPGSYIHQPAGEFHSNANTSGANALVLVIYDGPMDAILKN